MRKLRNGVAMIELVFAIVVIGLVLTSVPLLMHTAAQSSYVATQQEAVNEAAAKINLVLGYAWDENNTDISGRVPILRVTSGNSALEPDPTNKRRIGMPQYSGRSFVGSQGTTVFWASAIGKDAGETTQDTFDDIDDFNGTSQLVQIEAAGGVDYVDRNVTLQTSVTYGNDTPSTTTYNAATVRFDPFSDITSGTSNIKNIKVTLTTRSDVEDLAKNIVLRAFSCNIGEFKLEERFF